MTLAQRLRTAVFDLPALKEFRNRFQQNERQLKALQTRVEVLEAELSALRWPGRIQELLGFLKPMKAVGFEKVRLGRDRDGGYVMLNDFTAVSLAYSLGIAGEVSWDLDVARRGIPVRQFDFSIDEEPVKNPLFTFAQTRVQGMRDLVPAPQANQILKIDIERSEWNFFSSATLDEMKNFRQITGEFHDIDHFSQMEWWTRAHKVFSKINETHQLIHIHGNNDRFAFSAGPGKIPVVLELTYALRSAYQFEETSEPFPGPLDFMNVPDNGVELDLNFLVRRA